MRPAPLVEASSWTRPYLRTVRPSGRLPLPPGFGIITRRVFHAPPRHAERSDGLGADTSYPPPGTESGAAISVRSHGGAGSFAGWKRAASTPAAATW